MDERRFQVFFRGARHGTLDEVSATETVASVVERITKKLGQSSVAVDTRLLHNGRQLYSEDACKLEPKDTVHILNRVRGGVQQAACTSNCGREVDDAICFVPPPQPPPWLLPVPVQEPSFLQQPFPFSNSFYGFSKENK